MGELFENGEYFIGRSDVFRNVVSLCTGSLSPSISNTTSPTKGRILIGVVEKDIHDIGKDIVAGLLTSDGFDVIDLGTDVSPKLCSGYFEISACHCSYERYDAFCPGIHAGHDRSH